MKSLLIQSLSLCVLGTALLAANSIFISDFRQVRLPLVAAMADDTAQAVKVPGNNNATYGPVPQAEQLLDIEFLDMAPSPIPVNQIFFTLLRGSIPPSKRKNILDLPALLTTATLNITLSAVLKDGKIKEPKSYSVPFRTTAFGDLAHVSIRNATGAYVEEFDGDGRNDVLTDCLLPGLFMDTGVWTFEVVVTLGDERCLFAVSVTQWFDRKNN